MLAPSWSAEFRVACGTGPLSEGVADAEQDVIGVQVCLDLGPLSADGSAGRDRIGSEAILAEHLPVGEELPGNAGTEVESYLDCVGGDPRDPAPLNRAVCSVQKKPGPTPV